MSCISHTAPKFGCFYQGLTHMLWKQISQFLWSFCQLWKLTTQNLLSLFQNFSKPHLKDPSPRGRTHVFCICIWQSIVKTTLINTRGLESSLSLPKFPANVLKTTAPFVYPRPPPPPYNLVWVLLSTNLRGSSSGSGLLAMAPICPSFDTSLYI